MKNDYSAALMNAESSALADVSPDQIISEQSWSSASGPKFDVVGCSFIHRNISTGPPSRQPHSLIIGGRWLHMHHQVGQLGRLVFALLQPKTRHFAASSRVSCRWSQDEKGGSPTAVQTRTLL